MSFVNPMLQHTEKEWPPDPVEISDEHGRRMSAIFWATVSILTIGLGALIYYAYRTVKTQDLQITRIFGDQGTLNTLAQRADAAETKVHDLAVDWQNVGQRVMTLEIKVAAEGKQTRLYTQSLTQQLHQQLIAEMDARTSNLDTRLRQVESEQADQRAQLADVKANLKQEISTVRDENGRDLSGVRQQEGANERDISALSQKIERERIDFELAKGQTKELVPGISLRIQGVNRKHQRYRGALWLMQDHRTVWLRDQSVHESVRFFHKDGEEKDEPYELVVTDVTKSSASGYLLAPRKREGSEAVLTN